MYKRGVKFWYRVRLWASERFVYIVYAANEDDAKETFRGLGKRCQVSRLTWFDLSALTDCLIPNAQSPNSPAVGDLMFGHDDKFFILRVKE